MGTNYPTPEQVQKETEQLAPIGWVVSIEYPNYIGVTHKSFYDSQSIYFGDTNEHFAFNDEFADPICGSMEGLTDPKEIAASFWKQLAAFYPELLKGE